MRYALVPIGLALLGGCVVTGGRGGDTAPPTPSEEGAPSEQRVCPDPSGLPNPVATITTSLGTIKVELLEDAAPNTVASFVSLAQAGFFEGHIFHRVIPGFMIQGGSPEGHPAGGPGYTFADEINAAALGLDSILLADREDIRDTAGTRGAAALSRYIANQLGVLTLEEFRARRPEVAAMEAKVSVQVFYEAMGYTYTACLPSISLERGVLAMANAGPDTNGSQFFITHVDTGLALDGKHTGFGLVVEGMDVVDAIGAVERDEKNRPKTDVVIESVVVEGLRDHEYVPVSVPRAFPD